MNMPDSSFNPFEQPPPMESAWVRDVRVRAGSRVILRPGRRADIFDMELAGKAAVIESLEQTLEGKVFAAVTVDDDPGRAFGVDRKPAHRFFFSLDEIEPLPDDSPSPDSEETGGP